MPFSITQYSKNYKHSVLKLMEYLWKGTSKKGINEMFSWRYEQNPFQNKNSIYLAIDKNEEVIGFRAFVEQKFCINSKNIKVFCPADAIIHPNFRRKKIYSVLTKTLIDNLGNENSESIIISLSSNERSSSANIKFGWQKTNGIINYGYKSNLLYLFSGKNPTKNLEVELNYKNYDIAFSNEIEEKELEEFNKQHVVKNVLINSHTEDFYKWRYRQHPKKEDYVFVYLRRRGKLCAYLILNKLSSKQMMLEEYHYANEEDFKTLLSMAIKELKPLILRAWILNNHDMNILSRIGFRKENPSLIKLMGMNRFPITVRPLVAEPEEKDFFVSGLDIRDLSNWKIYKADSH